MNRRAGYQVSQGPVRAGRETLWGYAVVAQPGHHWPPRTLKCFHAITNRAAVPGFEPLLISFPAAEIEA